VPIDRFNLTERSEYERRYETSRRIAAPGAPIVYFSTANERHLFDGALL